jgi:hypothetical protein
MREGLSFPHQGKGDQKQELPAEPPPDHLYFQSDVQLELPLLKLKKFHLFSKGNGSSVFKI